jgi:hypothetical protein
MASWSAAFVACVVPITHHVPGGPQDGFTSFAAMLALDMTSAAAIAVNQVELLFIAVSSG